MRRRSRTNVAEERAERKEVSTRASSWTRPCAPLIVPIRGKPGRACAQGNSARFGPKRERQTAGARRKGRADGSAQHHRPRERAAATSSKRSPKGPSARRALPLSQAIGPRHHCATRRANTIRANASAGVSRAPHPPWGWGGGRRRARRRGRGAKTNGCILALCRAGSTQPGAPTACRSPASDAQSFLPHNVLATFDPTFAYRGEVLLAQPPSPKRVQVGSTNDLGRETWDAMPEHLVRRSSLCWAALFVNARPWRETALNPSLGEISHSPPPRNSGRLQSRKTTSTNDGRLPPKAGWHQCVFRSIWDGFHLRLVEFDQG